MPTVKKTALVIERGLGPRFAISIKELAVLLCRIICPNLQRSPIPQNQYLVLLLLTARRLYFHLDSYKVIRKVKKFLSGSLD